MIVVSLPVVADGAAHRRRTVAVTRPSCPVWSSTLKATAPVPRPYGLAEVSPPACERWRYPAAHAPGKVGFTPHGRKDVMKRADTTTETIALHSSSPSATYSPWVAL
jgi:hypothetical protein